ncbi:cellulose-binding domain-containing protein [Streptomyces sp. NPDC006610]|uniref:cellulose-binding domain-containing protein n=1 Tax=Streptomyces sp. NPDC006610 TaxID=3154584 RepID=UPI0033A46BA3
MPDLPTPRDATEAALFTECWDTVLSYADLCTSGSAAATRLAREAFAHGMRQLRAADAAAPRGAGRRAARLPRIPLLLTAVRTTAADWEDRGEGHRLDPELRLWLGSEQAARFTGPPSRRPLALRALRDMQAADAELLWLTEVEALPLPVAARRLGLAPEVAADELADVRGLFRDRCLRNHLDTPMDPECGRYARLLDAVTRSPVTETPDDLSRHLAQCLSCGETAACLRLHGGGLPGALATGVVGWGGLAYLERRRRAADVRLGAGRPDQDDGSPLQGGTGRTRVLRNGLLVAAVLVSVLALAVTLVPSGDPADEAAPPGDTADRQPVADPWSSPAEESTPARPSPSGARPGTPAPAPQGARPTTPGPTPTPTPTPTPAASCRADYRLVGQWPDGFQATVKITTDRALDDWRVGWTFRDGQHVNQMWDATFTQTGADVTARAADYNKAVPEGGALSLGFLASWKGANSPAYDFTLNGRVCATS